MCDRCTEAMAWQKTVLDIAGGALKYEGDTPLNEDGSIYMDKDGDFFVDGEMR